MALVLASPILHEDVQLRQLLLDAVGVGCVSIDLVDGKNHGDFCRLGVVDGFLGLRHDAVVRGNHNDGQVRHLGAARTHRREGLVTRRIQERHLLATVQLHGVGTNVLGDASSLSRNDIGFAHKVEQRRLAVVDVTHDRDDGRTGDQIVFGVFFHHNGLLHFGTHKLHFKAKLFSNDGDGF